MSGRFIFKIFKRQKLKNVFLTYSLIFNRDDGNGWRIFFPDDGRSEDKMHIFTQSNLALQFFTKIKFQKTVSLTSLRLGVVFHLDYLKVLLASGLQSLPSVLKCFRCDFVIVNAETFLSDAHICLECPSFVLLCDNCYQVPSHRLSHASHVFTRARSWEQCHYVRYQLMKR